MRLLANSIKKTINESIELSRRTQNGLSPTLITSRKREQIGHSRNVLSFFLLGDMFASKRDILALLVRYIVASLQCDMISIPSCLAGHIACRRQISLPKGISQITTQVIYIVACSPLRITRYTHGVLFS